MTQEGRDREAEEYVRQASDYLAHSSQLFEQAIPFISRSAEKDQALQLAEEWVGRSDDDARPHMHLAQVLEILAQAESGALETEYRDRAEQEFQRAIALEPSNVQTWIACLGFYSRSLGGRDKALVTLTRLANEIDVQPLERAFVLAQLYDSLSQHNSAPLYYREAIELAEAQGEPRQIATVLSRAARYYADRVPTVAERFCRRALELEPKSILANQVLLELLAFRGTDSDIAEAQATQQRLDESMLLTDSNEEPLDLTGSQRFARALILANGPAKDTAGAITLLENAIREYPDDRLFLATLYERSERPGSAYEVLNARITALDARPQDFAAFIRFWQDNFRSSGQFLRQAEKVYDVLGATPGYFGERLRWKLRELVLDDPAQLQDWSALRGLLDPLWSSRVFRAANQHESAETLFSRALAVLLEEGATVGAVELCRRPPSFLQDDQPLIHLCHAAILAEVDEQLQNMVEENLRSALASSSNLDLLGAAADFAFMSTNYKLAAERYAKLLAADPTRRAALNNFALALSEQPARRAEASQVLLAALQSKPDDPGLLDTQGVLALHRGEPQQALDILDRVIDAAPTDPAAQLHRAMALRELGHEERAIDAFVDALTLNLTNTLLSPSDRQATNQLRQDWSL